MEITDWFLGLEAHLNMHHTRNTCAKIPMKGNNRPQKYHYDDYDDYVLLSEYYLQLRNNVCDILAKRSPGGGALTD